MIHMEWYIYRWKNNNINNKQKKATTASGSCILKEEEEEEEPCITTISPTITSPHTYHILTTKNHHINNIHATKSDDDS